VSRRPTLYAEVGGDETLADVVRIFHARLEADPAVQHFFPPNRAASLMARQRRYFAAMLGGPGTNPDEDLPGDLAAAHATIEIEDHHVAIVVSHLRAAFLEAGVDATVTERVVNVAARLWWARSW
jgi:truncated hemoglobin YjbI